MGTSARARDVRHVAGGPDDVAKGTMECRLRSVADRVRDRGERLRALGEQGRRELHAPPGEVLDRRRLAVARGRPRVGIAGEHVCVAVRQHDDVAGLEKVPLAIDAPRPATPFDDDVVLDDVVGAGHQVSDQR